jgi:hypothetical protein
MAYSTYNGKYTTLNGKMNTIVVSTYPKDGIVSAWKFEDNLFDSENGYNLWCADEDEMNYPNGKIGKCTLFNMFTPDRIAMFEHTGTSINSNNWSANFWFNLDIAFGEGNCVPIIIGTGTYDSDWDESTMKTKTGVAAMQWIKFDSINPTKMNLWFIPDIDSSTSIIAETGVNWGIGWHMITMQTGTVWLDNVKVIDEGPLFAPGFWLNNICIGTTPDDTYKISNKKIDNTYLYNKVLSDTEINQLWNNGNGI